MGVWGIEVPQWDPGAVSVRRLSTAPSESEALCTSTWIFGSKFTPALL